MTLFGINGVRGTANRDLTPEVALQIGKVVGRTFGRRIAVATDARDSADMLRSAVSAGVMASGTDIVDLGILPTPVLQYYVKSHPDITGGIVITASHNPPEHNGFKFIKEDGVEVSREEEQSIESSCETDIPPAPWKEIGEVEAGTGAIVDHVNAVIAHVDAETIRRANLTVCVDCANGSTCESTPMLLRLLNVRTFTINADPQSESPGRSSEPTEENLGPLMMLTKQVGADLGAAHDADGDRTIFVTEKGEYVMGDISLALIAKSVLSERKGKVITPVSSSSVVEDVVEENGGLLKYTAVGSHTVVRKMEENMAVFGGEENGGLVFPELQIIPLEQFQRVTKAREQRSINYAIKCGWETEKVTLEDGNEATVVRSSGSYPRKIVGKALLSGNVYCGHCGGRVFATTARKAHHPSDHPERIAIYKCYNRTQHKEQCDGPTTYRAEKVDSVVESILRGIFERAKRVDEKEFLKAQVQISNKEYQHYH